MKKIRIGVAGAGRMGMNHCNVINRMKNVDFIGIYDTDFVKLEKEAKRLQVTAYTSYEEFLDSIDALVIAVPTTSHYELAKQAIIKNKHVFIEKPLAPSLEQAEELGKLLRGTSLVLQVGHIERFNPSVEQLYKVIDRSGIISLESRRVGNVNRNLDVDVVLDLMIHDIDIILDIVNSPIKKVAVVSNSILGRTQPDFASVLLAFQSGVIANLTVSRISKDKIRSLIITEVTRTITLDFVRKELFINHELIQAENPLPYQVESKLEKIVVPANDSLTEELEHFITCIQDGIRPKVGIEEAIKTIKVVMKIKQQMFGETNGRA